MATKILELSAGEPMAKKYYPDADVTAWDFSAPIPESMYGTFDIVFSNNVLQRASFFVSQPLINSWCACLKEGGQLNLVVPSLEWACRELLSDNPSPVSQIMMWGGQGADNSVHMSGFTMRYLRALFEKAGLMVIAAHTDEYTLQYDKQEYKVQQHVISATKGFVELQRE